MSSFFENLLSGAAGYYNQDKASQAALELGERGAQEAARLGTETAGMAEFKPFTVRTGLGTATTTPEGGFGLQLDPRQQAIQDTAFGSAYGFMSGIGQDPMSQLLGGQALQAYQGLGPSALTGMGVSGYQNVGQDPMQQAILAQARQGFANIGQDPRQQALLAQADTAFGRAMADPSQAQADIYGQIRAAQRPEEERQSLALEERMLSQGRMGLSSDMYGGANPEMLALAQAEQEAMLKANLGARSQAMSELGQFSDMGTAMLTGAYTPQSQALGLLGAGTNVAQLADLGRREGAGQFGTVSQKGFESLTQLLNEATTKGAVADQAAYDILRDILSIKGDN